MIIHPQSFRALAYEVQMHLTGGVTTDDTRLKLPLIEQELRHQTGIYLKKINNQNERLGADPDPSRLQTMTVNLTSKPGDGFMRIVPIAGLMVFNGRPYTQFVGIADDMEPMGFTPCDYRWQLKAMIDLGKKPGFAVESNQIVIRLTAETIALETVTITSIPADPLPTDGRGDEWYWKNAWFMGEEGKGEIKMQAIRVFLGTHIQLRPLADTKNNGTEG